MVKTSFNTYKEKYIITEGNARTTPIPASSENAMGYKNNTNP